MYNYTGRFIWLDFSYFSVAVAKSGGFDLQVIGEGAWRVTQNNFERY